MGKRRILWPQGLALYLAIGIVYWQALAYWAMHFKPGGHDGPDPYGLPMALSLILFWPLMVFDQLVSLLRR